MWMIECAFYLWWIFKLDPFFIDCIESRSVSNILQNAIYKAEHFCVFFSFFLLSWSYHEVNYSAHFNCHHCCILLEISVDPIYSGRSKRHQSGWLGKKEAGRSGRRAIGKCGFSIPDWYQYWYVPGTHAVCLDLIRRNRHAPTAVYIAPWHRLIQHLGAHPRMRSLLWLSQTFFSALKFLDIHDR